MQNTLTACHKEDHFLYIHFVYIHNSSHTFGFLCSCHCSHKNIWITINIKSTFMLLSGKLLLLNNFITNTSV